jgi:hypothetical protein
MRWIFAVLVIFPLSALPAVAADYPDYDCAEGGYDETPAQTPMPDSGPTPTS